MKTFGKPVRVIGIIAAFFTLLSCEEEGPEENCLSFTEVTESYFMFDGSSYDVSANDLEDFVICSGNTIDAFWSANNSNEITFGFDRFNTLSSILIDQGSGLPNSSLLLTQGAKTYVAVAGQVSPCKGGYVFSADMQELTDPSDLSSTSGSARKLEGFIKCP